MRSIVHVFTLATVTTLIACVTVEPSVTLVESCQQPPCGLAHGGNTFKRLSVSASLDGAIRPGPPGPARAPPIIFHGSSVGRWRARRDSSEGDHMRAARLLRLHTQVERIESAGDCLSDVERIQ